MYIWFFEYLPARALVRVVPGRLFWRIISEKVEKKTGDTARDFVLSPLFLNLQNFCENSLIQPRIARLCLDFWSNLFFWTVPEFARIERPKAD
ncbi:MAG: hypothetical protein D6714_13525 [Bacteroidetes bacterium]|nr:MAG: hypothetical protein D6714_13525 [Bacteroidota bacterium]